MTRRSGRLVEYGYIAGWHVAGRIPERVARPLVGVAASSTTRRYGLGVQRLANNLRMVVGPDMEQAEFHELVHAAVHSYARYWYELFRLPALSNEAIMEGFHLVHEENIADPIARGRGLILALPHMANWDIAGAWIAAKGWPIVTVAERLKPERLFERFLDVRRKLGMEILPLTGGDRSVVDVLVERLNSGHVVALVSDRDLSDRGVDVEFFGHKAMMPPGPALLAIRSGAPLMTVSLWYEEKIVKATVQGPLPVPKTGSFGSRVRQLTQHVADNFASSIASHPQDWHMMQRIWSEPKPPSHSSVPADP